MPWKISNDGYKFHKKVAIFDAFLFDNRSILINFFQNTTCLQEFHVRTNFIQISGNVS